MNVISSGVEGGVCLQELRTPSGRTGCPHKHPNVGFPDVQTSQEVRGHPLSIYPEHSVRLWNKPHTEQLRLFSLQNRIILDNPGHNLIMILDNDKLHFISFSLVAMHSQGRTVEGLGREGRLFIYILIKKENQ